MISAQKHGLVHARGPGADDRTFDEHASESGVFIQLAQAESQAVEQRAHYITSDRELWRSAD